MVNYKQKQKFAGNPVISFNRPCMTSLPHKSLPLISYEKNNQILQTMELPTTGTQIFTLFIFLFFQLFPFILTSPDLSDINPPQQLKSQQLQTPSQEPNSEEPQTPPQNSNSEEPQNPPQEPNHKLHNNPPQNPTAQHFQPKIPPKHNSQQPQNPPQKSNYKQTNNPPQNPKSQPKISRTPNPEEPQTPPQNYNSHQPQNPPKKPNYKQTNNPPQNPKISRKPNSEEPQTPSQKSNSQQPQNPPQNPKSQYFQPKIPRLLPHFRQSEQEQFLNAHNKARAHAGLSLFVWDETLASYARTWAKKRSSDCRMKHSNGPYGENIFWGGRDHWTPKDVVKLWVKEHKFYNRKTNACQPGKLCGHYTQIVWSDSIKVGCARAKCANGGIFVICSYDPPGNYANENPFKPNNNNNDTNNDNENIKQ
ncbi:probable pathogenesis-related protein CaO19.6200 [Durio zibethinus]|uniref:Probable pathogenesis-related protein CaO19.6200 n=1 Tax=Durio zibethinus TaxID=66656 RepID=A0A6P6A4X1_DURZI|nr:probable pathogenesis-related protein CaO19.6200 [Durio zibethinus]